MRKSMQILTGGGDQWKKVKERFSPAVIQIDVETPRSFGEQVVGTSSASGFIVDKARGIVLTNKHVIGDGPIRAKAKFLRNEEIDLVPIYRDPVHDYGFFRFDPKLVKETPLVEIKLAPETAKPQQSVLIMGNNAGEKLTYVESTIGRTDRNYIEGFDCNTFYISATDITVGGASGGPMLNQSGQAVGMVAMGDSSTNSSFYLPLERAARALKFIQAGSPVPRGTIQTAFLYKTYPEVERLGASKDVIETTRKQFPSADGMLVVSRNLPKGPGAMAGIKNGDVLFKVNGKIANVFLHLAEAMDDSVGKEIVLEVYRRGERKEIKVTVQDLTEISPSELVEISEAIVSSLSYPLAMQCNLPIEGVVLSSTGYMFSTVGTYQIIIGIGSDHISDIQSFLAAMKKYENGAMVPVKYFHPLDPVKKRISQITIDKKWYPFLHGKRNDTTGKWDYIDCMKQVNISDDFIYGQDVKSLNIPSGVTQEEIGQVVVAVTFSRLMVLGDSHQLVVDFEATSRCVGIIVNRALGLVVCDRCVVGTTLGDVAVDFGSVLKIPAKIVYVSPTSSFAVIQYDPRKVEADVVANVKEMRISDEKVKVGENLNYIGSGGNQTIEYGQGQVVSLDFVNANVPFNCETMSLSGEITEGAYYDPKTLLIKGFAINDLLCIPAFYIKPHVDAIEKALMGATIPPSNNLSLAVHLETRLLSKARNILNLSDEWAIKLKNASDGYRNVLLSVNRRMAGTPSYDMFEDNDVILAINDEPVCLLSRYVELTEGKSEVSVTVLRDGQVMDIGKVKTTEHSTTGTTRVITFAGMALHAPHAELYYRTDPEKLIDGGVFVASIRRGSPAGQEHINEQTPPLDETVLYTVNGEPIGGLDDFIEGVSRVKQNEYVSIGAVNTTTGETALHSIRLDLEYWPTRDYVRDEALGWNYKTIQHDK